MHIKKYKKKKKKSYIFNFQINSRLIQKFWNKFKKPNVYNLLFFIDDPFKHLKNNFYKKSSQILVFVKWLYNFKNIFINFKNILKQEPPSFFSFDLNFIGMCTFIEDFTCYLYLNFLLLLFFIPFSLLPPIKLNYNP